MSMMLVALPTVAVMLLYALPGFLLVKTRLVPEAGIAPVVKLLMYIAQPALIIYSFLHTDCTPELLGNMGLALVFFLLAQGGVMVGGYFLLKKRASRVAARIFPLAAALGNCGFMGVPLLQALLPDHPEAIAYSVVASLALHILSWTLGCAIITGDKRYIRFKEVILNPAVLAMFVALPLFLCGVKLPTLLDDMVTLLAKMATPLCMIIMGMRLATCSLRGVFGSLGQYAAVAVKQLLFPLAVLGVLTLLSVDPTLRVTVYILICCPVASMVLNFAEMLGEGQKTAAHLVLLGTLLSVFTVPLMMLLV
ncbi:MAG: AEC family transporter [Clostridia bacterium]|nr:AEC family transporter [Clostridia bacterium]